MKKIYYELNVGTNENPCLVSASMTYSESNLEIAEKEAHNGEYQILEEADEIEE